MRVLHVIAGPYPAFRGSQVLVAQLVRGLAERGHRVGVVSYGGRLADRPGFHPARLPLDAYLLGTLWRRVASERVDAIHAHNYEAGAAALVVGRACGVPVVFHGHSAMEDEMPLYARHAVLARLGRRVGVGLDGSVPRRAAATLAVSAALAARLRARGVSRVVHLSPCLHPAEVPTAAGGAEAAVPTVVYAGNLDAYQNLDGLLAAFERVRARVPQARLVLATHGDARAAARRRWPGGPPPGVEILFATTYEEARRAIAAAWVVVLPRRERTGYPMKILNYMAEAKAIVATRSAATAAGADRWVRLVPDADMAAVGDAIADLLDDPGERVRLGQHARLAVADRSRYDESMARVEAIYEEVRRHD